MSNQNIFKYFFLIYIEKRILFRHIQSAKKKRTGLILGTKTNLYKIYFFPH